MAFAGFGSSSGRRSKGASSENPNPTTKGGIRKQKLKNKPVIRMDLDAPQGRMDHIQNCTHQ
jgi:hypothetical protein